MNSNSNHSNEPNRPIDDHMICDDLNIEPIEDKELSSLDKHLLNLIEDGWLDEELNPREEL